MKVQRMMNTQVVTQEGLDETWLPKNSAVSYSILASYEDYVLALINFENVLFIWPTQKQVKGKSKGQQGVTKSYAGFAVGNLVQLEVQLSHATNLAIEVIVAERNFSKESKT